MPGILSIVMPFRGSELGKADITRALQCLTLLNVYLLRGADGGTCYKLPKLYQSGVRYRRESRDAPNVPGACERFLTAPQCYAEQVGDCEDLAAWRACELILAGDKKARAIPIQSSIGWHCVVMRGDGTIEDPSKKLGMKGST